MREWWRETSRLARAALTFAATVTASVALFIAALLWLPAIGSPSGDSLRYSLMRGAGGSLLMGDLYACEERPSGMRICEVPDAQNSGFARYRVRLDGRCWHARKVSPDRWEEQVVPMRRNLSGCVQFRDQVRLVERFFGA
jgi:hypothetical protein